MLSDKNIMAFVATTKPDEAQHFYQDILGLELKSRDNYALLFDANGINLRVTTVPKFQAPPYSVISWMVSDIESEVKELAQKNVSFEKYGFADQDELGIWTAPGGAKIAWFKDPEGNILSLSQFN